MVDFTNCPKVGERAYGGVNGKKIAIEYDGEIYMLKFPPLPRKKIDISYTNSCISEHICSRIFESIGIPAQKTILGIYTVNEKEKIVCACKDFTENNKVFFDFCSIKNTVIDSSNSGNGTELSEIIETIALQDKINPKTLMDFYFDMFVIDAMLGNFDRHNGNFGFLLNKDNKTYEIAPIYDCGSCLFPQADDEFMKLLLNDRAEFNSRIYNFPTSMIKINDKKINYHDFINSLENQYCNEAIKRIVPKIDIRKINNIVDDTPFISSIRKDFYKKMINARFESILQPALKEIR